MPACAGTDASTSMAVSSFDYGRCVEAEDCSVVQEYRQHAGDANPRSVPRAVVRAALVMLPVAGALIASQW
jgi:hypothetical protein